MQVRELRNWINNLPETFDEYSIVNGEVGVLNEQFHYRIDKPITTLLVDEKTHEVIILNESEEDLDNELNGLLPEDKEVDTIIEALRSEVMTEELRKQIELDTFNENKPMYYIKDGWLVEHHQDGTIKKIKKMLTVL